MGKRLKVRQVRSQIGGKQNQRDTLRSLEGASRMSRALGSLFGLGTASRLADSRLEALRRAAVYAWRRGFALPMAEIDRFKAAGFVEAQLETLVVSGDHAIAIVGYGPSTSVPPVAEAGCGALRAG